MKETVILIVSVRTKSDTIKEVYSINQSLSDRFDKIKWMYLQFKSESLVFQ